MGDYDRPHVGNQATVHNLPRDIVSEWCQLKSGTRLVRTQNWGDFRGTLIAYILMCVLQTARAQLRYTWPLEMKSTSSPLAGEGHC